ncbi:MAG: M20/M25/M40 family metallo-hydrolase [Myxococcales bacterium]|nr:M20/M25/M40 family metallo-hydrolase [Myxococcales bacterium]
MPLLLSSGCDDESDAAPDGALPDATADATAVDASAEDASGPDATEGDAMAPDGAMPGDDIAALIAAADLTRYSEELEFISRGPRPSPDGAHWQAAQDRCADAFLGAGLEVTRQPIPGGGVNVIGVLPGTTRADEQIITGAHYDSVWDCAGADDNASGVAGVIEAARVLATRRYERTLVFLCFDAEEDGLVGSTDYALRARERGDDVKGVVVFEMIGYRDPTPGSQSLPQGIGGVFPAAVAEIEARESRGDFIVSIGDDDPAMIGHLQSAAALTGLPIVSFPVPGVLRANDPTGVLGRSDHAPFWAGGYPALMLTDTAELRNPRYHCGLGDDDIDSVDVEFALMTTATVIGGLAAAAVPAAGAPAVGRVVEPAPTRELTPTCDAPAGTCDDGQRCALVIDANPRLACLPPPAAPLDVDAPCVRDAMGRDACAPGLFCTLTGRPSGAERRCRPLCFSADDCAAGQVCPWLGYEVSNCIDACDPFADDCPEGTRCGPGIDNDGRRNAFNCQNAGPVGEGGDCTRDRCARGFVCAGSLGLPDRLGCVAHCDLDAPACGAGRTCRRHHDRGLPAGYGVCLPTDTLLD